MSHWSENCRRLTIEKVCVESRDDLSEVTRSFNDVCLLWLPPNNSPLQNQRLDGVESFVAQVASDLGKNATLVVLGEVTDLIGAHVGIADRMRYQQWIAIKRNSIGLPIDQTALPQHHVGALVYTGYDISLKHTKTRIPYSYCPACDKTTKDYGGKKHTYHEYGTLISDVWRDISCDLGEDISAVVDVFADLFGIEMYSTLRIIDCRFWGFARRSIAPTVEWSSVKNELPQHLENSLLLGDSLEHLQKIPDNTVDFAFADPPYNLKKKYLTYGDDLEVTKYFEWCDEWICELARVVKPGGTVALLNIPLWAIRHFLYMETVLDFQSWIVWDALSYPVRLIMPAHYAIICFSKGTPRSLPGFTGQAGRTNTPSSPETFDALKPLGEEFCLRQSCVNQRRVAAIDDRGVLTDIWWDIHRLKHNSRRVDHPCQLPPHLMYRLFAVFTMPGDVILDCFNGAGTSTLTAEQLGRNYIGIELSDEYHSVTCSRHEEISSGVDPFRKVERELTAKNSPVARLIKQEYKVPKKTLQLDVRRIATELGRLPTRDEVIQYSAYPIEYYDQYFVSWGEVCAAARTTGMVETRDNSPSKAVSPNKPHFYQPSFTEVNADFDLSG